MDIIDYVRQFVEDECKKPSSHYGYDPFENHFVKVVQYGSQLARKLDADTEIVVLSAWLHDIGSIMCGRKDHHITGAKIAVNKLTELGYPTDGIEKVRECILSHRGSQQIEPKTLEAQILIEADTLSAFSDIMGLFQCAFVYEKLSRAEAIASVIGKLENKWKQLRFEESKRIIQPKYEAAMLLLR